jgi:hypothetical protein
MTILIGNTQNRFHDELASQFCLGMLSSVFEMNYRLDRSEEICGFFTRDPTGLVRVGVRVGVTGMIVFVDLDGRSATVRDFTFDTLELNGGVIDTELLP